MRRVAAPQGLHGSVGQALHLTRRDWVPSAPPPPLHTLHTPSLHSQQGCTLCFPFPVNKPITLRQSSSEKKCQTLQPDHLHPDRWPRQQWETGDHWRCSRQWTVDSSTTVSWAGCCMSWQDKVHSGLHIRDFRVRLEWETLLFTAVHITMLLLIINQWCKSASHTEIQHH